MPQPLLQFQAIEAAFSGAVFDPRAPELAHRILRRAVIEGTETLRREVLLRTPSDTGFLGNSIQSYYPIPAGRQVEGVLGSPFPYVLPIEYGRTPGAPGPPFAPIHRWVQRVLRLRGKEAIGVAWFIRQKIHDEGFADPHKRGWRMFEQGFEAAKPTIDRIFQAAGPDLANAFNGTGAGLLGSGPRLLT